MTKNMGSLDRAMRLSAATLIVVLILTDVLDGALSIAGWVVAAIFVLTSLVSFCPLYRLFGIDTCGRP